MNIAMAMMMLLASPDTAQVNTAVTATPAPTEAAKTETDKRQICRVSTTTGSRLAQKKTCGTRAEWAIVNREAKDHLSKSVVGGAACGTETTPC